jgi:hypothetical protein
MAHILPIKASFNGVQLDSIVNVSSRVGPLGLKCTNAKNDVDAVEKLLILWGNDVLDGMQINNNGVFDPVTGYYIYRSQQSAKESLPQQVVDGIVSPARGSGYGGASMYSIVIFNLAAKKHSPQGYERFRQTFQCTE